MAHGTPAREPCVTKETTYDIPTEWEQRRLLVQAIMDNLMSILDKGSGDGFFSLRDIFEATAVTLDTIRARVAHQAFAGGPPEAFWPPMQALLDTFAPELGSLACGALEMAPAYERFWEPETRALMRDLGMRQDTPHNARGQAARGQDITMGTRPCMTPRDVRVKAARKVLVQKLVEQTRQLVERGGPAALRIDGWLLLHYEPEARGCKLPRTGETYYPLAAVIAALAYPCLNTLQEDWNEALGQPGPLPVYLHPTAEGHYTAMIAETVVLNELIWLTDECYADSHDGGARPE